MRITLPFGEAAAPYKVKPTKIIALGKNYAAHIAEEKRVGIGSSFVDSLPEEPVLFPKTVNTLIGPGEPIVRSAFLRTCGFDRIRTHYEAELAFFIGSRCRRVSAGEALDHILGFTCANDVSQRNIQGADVSGWFRGKSLDTFCPIGPRIVPLADMGDPENLHIECRLNGRVVQSASTSGMLFKLGTTVEFISKQITLEEGDVVLTGTPSGVGEIAHGDLVEVEIEGIGTLSNPVIDEGEL